MLLIGIVESFTASSFRTLIKRYCLGSRAVQVLVTDLYRSMRRNRMSLLSASLVPFLASSMSMGDPHMMNTAEQTLRVSIQAYWLRTVACGNYQNTRGREEK